MMSKIGMAPIPVVPVLLPPVLPLFQQPPRYQWPAYGTLQCPKDWMTMNPSRMFSVWGCLRIKNNRVVYNDLMGSFLFISLDGSICFFILYHYKASKCNFGKCLLLALTA